MQTAHSLLSLIAASLVVARAAGETCPPMDVVFVLDQSENARGAATNQQDYDLLKKAIEVFITDDRLSPTETSIGAYGYSGSLPAVEFIEEGSTPQEALTQLDNIGTGNGGSSRTYKGMAMVRSQPAYPNNLVIIISSQGTFDPSYQQQATVEYNRLTALGRDVFVIAAKGQNDIDYVELTNAGGGKKPMNLTSTSARIDYYNLPDALLEVLDSELCDGGQPVTAVPKTLQPGVCDSCESKAGYMFMRDAQYCDRYIICLGNQEVTRGLCAAGTLYNGNGCGHMNEVTCPQMPCTAAQEGMLYEHGGCCNSYYRCTGGALEVISCNKNEMFDSASKRCITATNREEVCVAELKYICGENTGSNGQNSCDNYEPDETGNPCYFVVKSPSRVRVQVAAGTRWNQASCSQVHDYDNFCLATPPDGRALDFDEVPADVCTSYFQMTNIGPSDIYSERNDVYFKSFAILNQASFRDGTVTYTSSMSDPYLYYYYFNNAELLVNTAFRMRFKMDPANTVVDRDYDLLSNSYCASCEATISIFVKRRTSGARVVTAQFLANDGDTLITAASATMPPRSTEEMEIILIFGDVKVYGQLNAVNIGSNDKNVAPNSKYLFNEIPKHENVLIRTNHCGFQLGRGPHDNFVGTINNFAMYTHCNDISSILRP